MEFLFGQRLLEPKIPHFEECWWIHKVLLWIMSSFLLRTWWKNSYCNNCWGWGSLVMIRVLWTMGSFFLNISYFNSCCWVKTWHNGRRAITLWAACYYYPVPKAYYAPCLVSKLPSYPWQKICMLCENVCFFVHFLSVVSAWLIIVLINNQILLKMLGAQNLQIRWNYNLKKSPNYTNSSHQWRPNGNVILISTLQMLPNM
jgi:hypothetical protein